jgi:hypothetical protein
MADFPWKKKLSRLRRFSKLPEFPGEIHNKPDHPQRYYNIQSRHYVIVGDTPGDNSSANHDSNVGYEKGKNAENGKYIQNLFLIYFLCRFGTGRKEEDQISHQQETGQVYQVTGFDENG